MPKRSASSLSLAILPPGYDRRRELCFELWHSEWSKTYEQLGEKRSLYSDEFFSREVCSLWHEQQPIGMILHEWFDVSARSHLMHSYFKPYPAEVLAGLKEVGIRRVMVASYMTLHADWRRQYTDVPIAEVNLGLSALRMAESNAEAMISFTRNGKKTNDMYYRLGGQALAKGQIVYNVEVDFAYIKRESLVASDFPGVAASVGGLWGEWKSRGRSKVA